MQLPTARKDSRAAASRSPPPELQPATGEPSGDYRDRYEAVAGTSLNECYVCRHVHMVFLELIPKPGRCTPYPDTS